MKTYLANLSCSRLIYSILYPKSEDKKIPFKKYIYLAGKETRFWGWKILAILLLCFLCFICIYLVTYPFLHSNAYYMTSFTSSFLSSPNWLLSKTIESFSNNLYPFILSLFLTLLPYTLYFSVVYFFISALLLSTLLFLFFTFP